MYVIPSSSAYDDLILMYLKCDNLLPPVFTSLFNHAIPFILSSALSEALHSHYYPDWSSLLILAPNVAACLSLSAPVLLLLCDVNEAFWFLIKRWPKDTERLINQDKAAGEGWHTAKHQPSSEYSTNGSYLKCKKNRTIVCMSQAFQTGVFSWGRRSL